MSITFKRTREVVVELCAGVHGESCLPATIDDLRMACEAVGLHVVEASWKDDWSELAKRLADVRKALDPHGTSHADIESMAAATVASRDLAVADAATLRAQLDELRAEQEVLRGQLSAAEEALVQAARDAPTEGRATVEELEQIAHDVYRHSTAFTDIAKAVAARVRREPGLVERLVAARFDFSAIRYSDSIRVTVCKTDERGNELEETALDVKTDADVPATLARLAGLDGGR